MKSQTNKLWPRVLSLVLSLSLVAGLMPAALAEEGSETPDPELNPATSISIYGLKQVTVGETITLTASVEPSNTTDTISWACTDSTVRIEEHNASCKVTGLSGGSATITATAGAQSDTYTITVSPATIEVTSVTLDKSTLSMTVGGNSETLKAKVEPSNATDQSISWNSDHSEVASVENGVVTARSAGTANITATAGGKTSAPCVVTVSAAPVTVTGVTISPSSASVAPGGTQRLTATVSPDTVAQDVNWSTTSAHASVDNTGLVNVNSSAPAGTSIDIVATSVADSSKSAVCTITVTGTATGVTVTPATYSLVPGGTTALSASVAPAAVSQAVTWSSGNASVAEVDSSGKVTVKANAAVGSTVRITATSTADGSKSGYATITVISPLALSKSSVSVAMGSTTSLRATTVPSSSASSVRWSSGNSNVIRAGSTTNTGTYTGSSCTLYPRATGSATITAQVTINGRTYTAACTVTVSGAGTATAVKYSTDENTPVEFDASDFNDVCYSLTGYSLNYVYFSLPSSTRGTLYYNYTNSSNNGGTVSASKKYYRTATSPYLSYVSFVPKSSYTGSVTIEYTGYNSQGAAFNGTVVVSVGAGSGNGDVTYTTAVDEAVQLDNASFNDYCKDVTGYNFESIWFTPPATKYGRLYYNYTSSSRYGYVVDSNDEFYRSSTPYLSDVTFVPASGYTGTLEIPFAGVSTNNKSFSGTLVVKVGAEAKAITYSTAANTAVRLDEDDFIDYCKAVTGYTFNYVTFDLPSSSRGVLYYDYSAGSSSNTKVTSNTKYYRTSKPYADYVTFVPANNYTGTVSISFTGYSSNSTKFTGTLKIYVGKNAGDVSYTASVGENVRFVVTDFNDFCKDETGSNLSYVTFDLPSSSRGVLYYDYSAGSNSNTKVSGSAKYYRTSKPYLDYITFVPANGYSGSVTIPFEAVSTSGTKAAGNVIITYSAPKEATVIRYTSNSSPVSLRLTDFISACNARGSAALSFVKFVLPDSSYGTLYNGYKTPATPGSPASATTAYNASGSPSIGDLVFVPKAGFTGTVTLNYTGTDLNNATYSGAVQIVVSPASSSAVFTDVGTNYSWAAASVDFLYTGGVVTGTSATQYSPANYITRGDFVLMLYRAFGLKSAGTSSFPDVPANSYYAQAIAAAKSMGIATGTGDGNFRPTAPLTRQDAMLLIQRTVQATGGIMNDGTALALSGFSDRASVASYAQGAVSALVQAGIIKGSNGMLNPTSYLTRAEMATILHRVLTM